MLLLSVVYLIWNALIHLTGQIWTTSKTLLITSSYNSQNHGLGKGKGTEVIEASGLSISYYVPGLWRVNGVMVGRENCNLQMHPLEVNL